MTRRVASERKRHGDQSPAARRRREPVRRCDGRYTRRHPGGRARGGARSPRREMCARRSRQALETGRMLAISIGRSLHRKAAKSGRPRSETRARTRRAPRRAARRVSVTRAGPSDDGPAPWRRCSAGRSCRADRGSTARTPSRQGSSRSRGTTRRFRKRCTRGACRRLRRSRRTSAGRGTATGRTSCSPWRSARASSFSDGGTSGTRRPPGGA